MNEDYVPPKREKVLLHMDGDAFFVGVEVAKDPKLKGLPVVTGQERGIVSALSYEAKALGITRGMPIFRVKKLFPTVIIMSGDYKSYATYSAKMFDIVRRYADDVEEYSIDECFADLTGLEPLLKMSYLEIAQRIKKEVNEELGLSITIGLAPTKVLAKVASKWVKPNGLTVITKDTAGDFLSKMSIDKIWGIGPRTAKKMIEMGIKTAGDFVNKDIVWVKENFSKPYEVIWNELRGEMMMHINTETKDEYASIQKTRTFHPATNDKVFLLSQLSKNIEDACAKARHYDLTPKKISFFLKDRDFKFAVSNVTLDIPTNTPEVLISIASVELERMWKKGVLYRTTGVTLQELVQHYKAQGNLFGNADKSDKFEAIHKELDTLENKLGKKLVHLASTQNALEHRTEGTDRDDPDRNLLFL
jgi:DNA polymerase-4/DNA polymerase V